MKYSCASVVWGVLSAGMGEALESAPFISMPTPVFEMIEKIAASGLLTAEVQTDQQVISYEISYPRVHKATYIPYEPIDKFNTFFALFSSAAIQEFVWFSEICLRDVRKF